MTLLYENNAAGTLADPITNSQLTITLNAGQAAYGTGQLLNYSGAANTTLAQTVGINLNLAVATDWMLVTGVSMEVVPQ
jgi:hypothetical protein